MRIGVDIDGVLADFNEGFIDRIILVTGEDKFPARPFDIPTWNYPEHYGYSREQVTAVWESVKTDLNFWRQLPAYEGASDAITALARHELTGNDVYFITARPGLLAKQQTEDWLREHCALQRGLFNPTVLISEHKGHVARALDLDVYIDDKPENCEDVIATHGRTRVTLHTQPWNINYNMDDGFRVNHVREFIWAL